MLVFSFEGFALLVFFFWFVEKGGGRGGRMGIWIFLFFWLYGGVLMALTLLDFMVSVRYLIPLLSSIFLSSLLPFQRGLLSSSLFLSIFFVLSCLSPFLRPNPPLKTKSFNPAFHFFPQILNFAVVGSFFYTFLASLVATSLGYNCNLGIRDRQ